MKMIIEEALIKVFQMYGIEHTFGIIDSAMIPGTDLFPAVSMETSLRQMANVGCRQSC